MKIARSKFRKKRKLLRTWYTTMVSKKKIGIVIGIIAAGIIGETVFFLATKHDRKPHTLMGTPVPVLSRKHVPDGTKITYNSNPPAAGAHYANPQDAGIYPTPPADGHLVHSLEHGAVILWYNPKKLSSKQINQLKSLFLTIAAKEPKIIMTPRTSLDVPVALSSWGRIMKLQTIDTAKITAFFTTNYDQGPEQAPI